MRIKLFSQVMHQSVKLAEKFPTFIPVVQMGTGVIVKLAYSSYQKYGVSVWDKFWIPAFYQYGQIRADYIRQKLDIDVNSAASIGRYHDYEDPIFGVEGHWETDEAGNAVRVETKCVVCDQLDKVTRGLVALTFVVISLKRWRKGQGKQ